MNERWQGIVALGVMLGLGGCLRVQTRVVELPRVDQERSGNQGYLAGSGPASTAARKTTRQIIMTDVELPTRDELRPVKGRLGPNARGFTVPDPAMEPEPLGRAAPTEPPRPEPAPMWDVTEELPPVTPMTPRLAPRAPASPTTYTVRKGDTLEKIAKQVYGDAKRWPAIYKANRHVLKNANRVYPGQKLAIPDLGESGSSERGMGPGDLK